VVALFIAGKVIHEREPMLKHYFGLFAFLLSVPVLAQNPSEEKVIKQIKELGGKVLKNEEGKVYGAFLVGKRLDFADPGRDISDQHIEKLDMSMLSSITILSISITDRALAHLEKSPKLERLCLIHGKITDKGLTKFLKKRKSLESLTLSCATITDKSLPAIGALLDLEVLSLCGTKITDKGIKDLRGLAKLDLLDLSWTKVTDVGLADLKMLKNLSSLSLDGADVTDVGILQLKTLTKLTRLSLPNTKVTKKGVEALQRELPRLEIRK